MFTKLWNDLGFKALTFISEKQETQTSLNKTLT